MEENKIRSVDIHEQIGLLVGFALDAGLIENSDTVFAVNGLLEVLELDSFEGTIADSVPSTPADILQCILDWAFENRRIPSNTPIYRDLFDSKLMRVLVPRPSEVIRKFNRLYHESPERATDWYYKFSQNTNYIRMDRISKNKAWTVNTPYGELDITINLSKPEKDPKAIEAARHMPASGYPKCLLCKENEGYAGRINHPGRHSHRIIPVTLQKEEWFLQYSPYIYYNEHSIILKATHEPMKIDKQTFERLLEFLSMYPHYFIGSNADLPIVGGSILSHDHFQSGRFTFAMERAQIRKTVQLDRFKSVEAGLVHWPMSVVRLRHEDRLVLADAAAHVLDAWIAYSDPKADIIAFTDKVRHNTVTPIARYKNGKYEMDLVLRNNRTTKAHPLGIFHPHADVHHIKKENIGLIEVLGLAILPARLETELSALACYWVNQEDSSALDLSLHMAWLEGLKDKYTKPDTVNEAREILEVESGMRFLRVLEDAGVFKNDAEGFKAFDRFIDQL